MTSMFITVANILTGVAFLVLAVFAARKALPYTAVVFAGLGVLSLIAAIPLGDPIDLILGA